MGTIVLVSCYVLIAFLFWEDTKGSQRTSRALWIPGIWLFILGTRQISLWFGRTGSNLDGNWLNAIVNGGLMLAAFLVLQQRRFNWGRFAGVNKALLLLYLYYALSPMWSAFPWPTFKRIVNDFGGVLVALVLVTESKPEQAMLTVFRRVSFVVLPLSIVMIRYFPAIGRASSRAGEPMFTGLSIHKNGLGEIAFLLAIVLLWDLLANRASLSEPNGRRAKTIRVGLLLLAIYLVYMAHSTSAQVCFVVGAAILCARNYLLRRFQDARRFATISIVVIIGLMAADDVLGLSDMTLRMLGKDTSLTGRTEIWELVRSKSINPLLGSGFRGFWETQAGRSIGEERNSNMLLTAHNGYLETYLNGGMIGVVLLVMMIWSGGVKALRKCFEREPLGAVTLAFWVVAVLYNNSESDFFIPEPLWFTWILVTIDWKSAVQKHLPAVGRLRIVSPTPVLAQVSKGLGTITHQRAVK